MLEIQIGEWLSLAIRWLHVITGIAWIGSSFYFVWLDNSLRPPTDPKDKDLGVGGELWAVHGGGFYHKKKYQVAPSHMPDDLHWFKWEAYFTWMSGFALLAVIYYFGADQFLIDKAKMELAPFAAIAISLGFIGGSWIFYNALCETQLGDNNRWFGIVWFLLLTVSAYALTHIFSDRAAYIHVGAMIGTAMACNVFMIIIPNQKKVVASLLAGEKPDPSLGKKAKQRSMHNNYMTLPVLFIMISNHYPMTFGHHYNWLVLAALGATAWPIREFFNQKHKGNVDHRYLVAGAVGFVLVALFASWKPAPKLEAGAVQVSDAEVKHIIRTHCVSCHSDTTIHADWPEAPMGLHLDTMEEIKTNAARIQAQAVDSDIMPLGNETEMTEGERAKLGAWIRGLSH